MQHHQTPARACRPERNNRCVAWGPRARPAAPWTAGERGAVLRREQLLRVDRRDSLQLLCRLLCSAAQAQQSHPQRPPGGRMMMVRRTCELELRCRHDALLPRSMGRTRLPRAAATAQAPPACATSLNPAYRPCPPPPCRPASPVKRLITTHIQQLCKVVRV